MQVFNHIYESDSILKSYMERHLSGPSSSVLVQVFSGVLDKTKLQPVLDLLLLKLPSAHIIGASTSGEIAEGKMHDNTITISFSVFEKTSIKTYYTGNVDFEGGKKIAGEVIELNTKAIICLSESLKSDPQNFFKGFETINDEIVIAGGNAGDNENFQETFVIKDAKIYDEGIVLCSLNSDELIVHNQYTLNWTPIGSELIVTKATNNIVYEINNRPVLEVYKYYFGKDIENNLPNSIVDFPLLKNENGTDVARSLIALLEDKSFLFAGHFMVGDKVRFAMGNIDEVLQNANKFSKEVSRNPSEGIFIYSCAVRRNFLKKELNNEFRLLEKIAPSCGFFTYGEFFNTGKSNQVLNITTTILSLSEKSLINEFKEDLSKKDIKHTPLKSLTHLVNVTQNELEDKIRLLQDTQNKLVESEKMASLGSLVAGIAHEVNTPLGVSLTGVSQINHEVKKLEKSFNNESLTEEDFTQYVDTMKQLTSTIYSSLDNAVALVKSFKNISVDQHSEEARVFNLYEYVNDTIVSLYSAIKTKNVTIQNNVNKEISMDSFPGIYSQIFSNLILNSVKHAFDDDDGNEIEINAEIKDDKLLVNYNDNGRGITPEIEKKIFDPFFTTARGQGGSGLGLNIVYNLIKQKLGGDIKVARNEAQGLHFTITIELSNSEGIK